MFGLTVLQTVFTAIGSVAAVVALIFMIKRK